MNAGKFLGIDFGTKRVGVSVSDEGHSLAFPKAILENNANLLENLSKIIKEENIKEIVIGESLDFNGLPNAISLKADVFIEILKKSFNLPVHKQKEFLTSVEARKPQNGKSLRDKTQAHSKEKTGKGAKVDAQAAALILQRYLDRVGRK
jgi:putative Holliday junction resolvase